MNPINPYESIVLTGDSVMRGVTLELPTEQVEAMLPHGLRLGAQDVTRPGTHPVVIQFNQFLRVRMSVPTLLPSLSYNEQTLGIPYCYLAQDAIRGVSPGPFYYMPRLWVDDAYATLGGVMFWGMAKKLAAFEVREERTTIRSKQTGRELTTLSSRNVGAPVPALQHDNARALRAMMDQPLVMMTPFAAGPFYLCANFDKDWRRGVLRPAEAALRIDEAYVPALPTGSFPHDGFFPSIDMNPLGAYELHVPCTLSMLFSPYFARWFAARQA
jgi:hypothetical protein